MMGVSVVPDREVRAGLLGGRYRVTGVVGRGAIAEVVRARDEQTGRQVALKLLHGHLRDSAVVVERFRREVEIVRRVGHRHVLPIHEVVEADGLLFLVMDYHPGGDLADRLARRGPLKAGALIDLARQLCGALGAAHRAGVVHRDVKPSNVLCGDGDGLHDLDVRLCDFGLAHMTEASGLTVASAVLGTPEYMAPEVISEGQADPRSDIYSLAVVLFEAATGRLPFYSDSPYQLMRQHLDVEPPRVRSLAPHVSPEIDAAIARALAKDPLDRFATTADFAAALTETTALTATPARAPSRRACPSCGGWLVEAAGSCADCGKRVLRLEWQRRGVSVMVERRFGKTGESLDVAAQAGIYRILIQAGAVEPDAPPLRPPGLPCYVARDLTPDSAAGLAERLRALGLTVQVVPRTFFGPPEMRQKFRTVLMRYLAVLSGGTYTCNAGDRLIDRILHLPRGPRSLYFLAPVWGSVAGVMSILALRTLRPLIARRPQRAIDRAHVPLISFFPQIRSRHDRRLIARILERVADLRASGHADFAAPLAERAALAARGLLAVEARRDEADAQTDPARAQAELRREEQARVLFRGDLLRTASRLDRAALTVARSQALSAADLRALREDVDDLAADLDAERELHEWLQAQS